MKKVHIDELNHWIESQRSDVERKVIRDRKEKKLVRMRERDRDEQKILDQICIERWKKAEQEGKIKYLSERKWHYEFD